MTEQLDCKHVDWQRTSSGVGHHHRPGYYFPDTDFETLTKEPLPPILSAENQVPNEQSFHTTTGDVHDRKFPNGEYGQSAHPKAPGHWKVNFMHDVVEKLNKPNFRRPLSPSHQLSEMQENYKSEAPLPLPDEFNIGIKNPLPKDHKDISALIKDDVSKQGPTHYNIDPSIVQHLDPYITTTHLTHRPFDKEETRVVKDQPTYWNCEDYTKAWGHGPKHNPLPKSAVPREPLPMRDAMVLREATKIGPTRRPPVHVMHQGLKSEQTDKYEWPSHVNMKYGDNCICPLDTPYLQPDHGRKNTYTVPSMYDTEYKNIGRPKPVTT